MSSSDEPLVIMSKSLLEPVATDSSSASTAQAAPSRTMLVAALSAVLGLLAFLVALVPTAEAQTPPVSDDVVTWSDIEPGINSPTITIDDAFYPETASTNRFETGVQFLINEQIDDRHPNRPNGWDATGPREGSRFHMHPALQIRVGDVIEAHWVDLSGVARSSTYVVGSGIVAASTPDAPVQPPAPSGLGDSRWVDVEPGENRRPTVVVADSVYPRTASDNTAETGVQFFLNESVDDRHQNRPNGWDATGPREDSTFHMHPALTLSPGDVLEARWIDTSGHEHTLTHIVGDAHNAESPAEAPVVEDDKITEEMQAPIPDDPGELERREPVIWANGTEVEGNIVQWNNVEAGPSQEVSIAIPGFLYPKTSVTDGFERGVQFRLNGEPYDEHPDRPNGWDSTGILEGSSFSMLPEVDLAPGDVIEARWVTRNDNSFYAVIAVPVPPEPAPVPDERGTDLSDEVTWTDVLQGGERSPTIEIGDEHYPATADDNSVETGVQFWINGEVDDRHQNRPDGWDATGPKEDSTFHIHPAIELVEGDVIEARWITPSGEAYWAALTVDDTAPPPPAESDPSDPVDDPGSDPDVPTGPSPTISGLGPTGQWPFEFGYPAYNTPADVVTDGSLTGLRNAIKQLDATGGVIEHPGNIVNAGSGGLTRDGSARIVIRPPLGKRAEYRIEGTVYLRGNGLLLAGFYHTSGTIYPYDSAYSGAAWLESDRGGEFRVTARFERSHTVTGLWYEAVYRNYVTDKGSDRSTVNALASGTQSRLIAVGVWMAGHARPIGSSAHVDTIQIVEQNGGDAGATIRNSVVWPSSNVALQGSGDTGFTIVDSWFAEPQYARDMFPFGDPGAGLDGHGAVTGRATISGSTMLGNTHPSSTVHIENSQLFAPGTTYIDQGGNTTLGSIFEAVPPLPPTHEELDAIWHD